MRSRFQFILLLISTLSHAGPMGTSSTWEGFYIGGNVGGAWELFKNELYIINNSVNPMFYPPSIAGLNFTGSNSFNPLRFTIGAQAGYNIELQSNFLAGLELNYNYLNLSETIHKTYLYPNTPTTHFYSIKNFSAAKQMGTLRPRLGYHYSNYLPYITAGGSLANLNYKEIFTEHQYNINHVTQYDKVRLGWTVGAGIEYFPLKNISFKLEYLYNNFGNIAVNRPFIGSNALHGLSATLNNSLKNIEIQTLLLGINVHII